VSWIRISDDFTDRAELLGLGDVEALAGWTYLRLLCWAGAHLSDGHVPVGIVRREDPTGLAALDSIGYVQRQADGSLSLPWFLVDHALSRDAVMALRAARSEAGKRGGQANAQAKAEARALALADENGREGQANARQDSHPGTRNPVTVSPSPGLPPNPPPSGGLRAEGKNPRARAQAAAELARVEDRARHRRREQRSLAYHRGAINESQLSEMNRSDAPLDQIPGTADDERVEYAS
jgi:hypothetical protein